MYKFYLGAVMLPISPSELKIKIKNQNTTMKLLNDGELNVLKAPGLSEFSFKATFPNVRYSFSQYKDGYKPAAYYLSFLEKLKTNCSVFDFTVIRILGSKNLGFNTSIKATLESYTLTESAEDGGDIVADITLKQYIAYGTKTLVIKENVAETETSRDTSSSPAAEKDKNSYTIKDGDSLWGIARTQLGDGTRWQEVYTKNKTVLDGEALKRGCPAESGDRFIFAGTEILIP